MITMEISLPSALKPVLDERVAEHGYGSRSAYILELIRRDQHRESLPRRVPDGSTASPTAVSDEASSRSLQARSPRTEALSPRPSRPSLPAPRDSNPTDPKTEAELARAIRLHTVHAYLEANGWLLDESANRSGADIYLWAEDDREAVIVPTSETLGDYATRIYQVADLIGRVEGRARYAVLAELLDVGSDSDAPSSAFANSQQDRGVGLRR